MSYIGVYGTLKKGKRANDLLSNSLFVGTFRVNIPFQMYDLGVYPALVKDENNIHPITLEVYDVKDPVTLKRLDNYEGYPQLYQKDIIHIENMNVIIYTMPNNRRFFEEMIPVESGNWE